MTASPRSTAQRRNDDLRQAVRAAFPGVKFGVRNGTDGGAAVTWTDGPTDHQVSDVLRTVRADTGRAWRCETRRTVSPELAAVAFLRARDRGEKFYSEKTRFGGDPIAAGDVRHAGDTLSWCQLLGYNEDGTDITDSERLRARITLSLADERDLTQDDDARVQVAVARIVFHHGDVIDAVLTTPQQVPICPAE